MKRQSSDEVSEMDIRQEYRTGIQRLTLALFNLEVPIIAAVNGHAIGAGLDLACMCDIRIASEKARFAESFIKLGIIPGNSGAWLLPRIVGMSRAAELAYTGDQIDARQALEWNLVSRVVPHDSLPAAAREMASRIAQHAGHSLRLTKRLMRESIHSRLDTVLEISAVFQAVGHQVALPNRIELAGLKKLLPRDQRLWAGDRLLVVCCGGADKNLDYLEVVHVFIRRPNSSRQALYKTRETHRSDHSAVGLTP
jgi:enoyl-CoA hydratase/carnithine racemase